MRSNTLIVVGMHRSGTSLTGAWLKMCGLHLGQRFSYANTLGTLEEDKDFVELHKRMLADQGMSHMARNPVHSFDHSQYFGTAQELIEQRSRFDQWGWKDPRTTLFLPFWHEILPEAKYLMVFRHYGEVVDSFHRRNRSHSLARPPFHVRDEHFDEWSLEKTPAVDLYRYSLRRFPRSTARFRGRVLNPLRAKRSSFWNVGLTKRYAQAWAVYNSAMVEFYETYPDKCICLSVEQLLNQSRDVIDYFNNRYGFCLDRVPLTDVYRSSQLNRSDQSWQSSLCKKLAPETEKIWQRLLAAESRSIERLEAQAASVVVASRKS